MKQNRAKIPQIIEHFELNQPLTPEERRAARKARWRILKHIMAGARQGLLVRQGITAARAMRGMGVHAGLKGGMRAVQALYAASFLLIAGAGWLTWDAFRPASGPLERPALLAWTAGPATVNGAPVMPGQSLVKADRVAVASPAVMLLDDGSVVGVTQQTEFLADSLASRAKLSLSAGRLLVRFHSGDGRGLEIRTPNATVTVHGTIFSVGYGSSQTRVAVSDGEVVVIRGSERLTLNAGEAVTVSETLHRTVAAPAELEELTRLASLPEIRPLRAYVGTESATAERAMLKPAESERLTLEDLREKYGRIDRVTLYNGKVIVGAIVSRGDRYTIETVSGTVRVKAKDVRQTSILQ